MTIFIDPLSPKSVKAAQNKLAGYRRSLTYKAKKIAERLADIGLFSAQVNFTAASYDYLVYRITKGIDGKNVKEPIYGFLETAQVDVQAVQESEDNKNGGGATWVITANGDAVAFIEFGAGVFYNDSPLGRDRIPPIVGIGEYGQGNGQKEAWGFYGEDGALYITRGTPEQPCMYMAAKAVRQRILEVAKEVFRE